MRGNHAFYDELRNYLARFPARTVTLTFREIESILGAPLPKPARTREAWWHNRKASLQAGAWRAAGCRVVALDLIAAQVTFRKEVVHSLQHIFGNPVWDRFQIRSLRLQLKLKQAAFAQLLGVCPLLISRWETGRTAPSYAARERLTSLAKLSRFAGV